MSSAVFTTRKPGPRKGDWIGAGDENRTRVLSSGSWTAGQIVNRIDSGAPAQRRALRSSSDPRYFNDSETIFQPLGMTVDGVTPFLIARVRSTLGRKKIR